MNGQKAKISAHQLMILSYLALLSPVMRVLPARGENGEAWLSVFMAALPVLLLIGIFQLILKLNGDKSFDRIALDTLGGFLGRIVLLLYFFWATLYAVFTVRFYTERMLSSSYARVPPEVFPVVLMALVLVAARGKLTSFSRAGEVFFWILALGILFTVVLAAGKLTPDCVWPVSYLDIAPAAMGGISISSVYAVFTAGLFLTARVRTPAELPRKALYGAGLFCLTALVVTLMITGLLGASVARDMSFPFFAAAKSVSLFGAIERLDSLAFSIWLIADFIAVTFLVLVCVNLLKVFFVLKDASRLATPLCFLILAGAWTIAPNGFTLSEFYGRYAEPVNIGAMFFAPLLLLAASVVKKIVFVIKARKDAAHNVGRISQSQ